MNTRAITLLLALAAATAAGCAPDRMSLSIQAGCYPAAACTFGETCDSQYIGTYAAVDGTTLMLFLQVANQSPNNGDSAVGRTNSNDAHVTGATIAFSGVRSGTFTVPYIGNQWVPAGGSAVIAITIPDPAAGEGTVNAQLRLTGYYDNGREFETGDYPVNYVYVAAGALGTCATVGDLVTCPGNGTNILTQSPSACGTP